MSKVSNRRVNFRNPGSGIVRSFWLLVADLVSCFALFIVLLMWFVDPIWHCDNLFGGKEGTGSFAFRWYLTYVISVLVCFLFFLVLFIGRLFYDCGSFWLSTVLQW